MIFIEGTFAKMFGGPLSPSASGTAVLPHTVEQHETVVTSYKQLIKQQDAELANLRHEVKRLHSELESAKQQTWQTQQNSINSVHSIADAGDRNALTRQLQEYSNMLAEKDRQIEALKAKPVSFLFIRLVKVIE